MLRTDLTIPPAEIADTATVDEVRAAVADARARGLRVAVQATGHGTSALGDLDGVLVVRTAGLTGIAVDAAEGRARIAAGHVWREVSAAVDPHGLAVIATAHPGVGVAGSVLGGGIGWLARSHGLAANAVEGIELVGADGRLIRADHERERDLFWALRGGGGGLGVITAVEVRLLALAEVYAGTLRWPAPFAAEVLHAWAQWIGTLPDELTSIARLRRRGGDAEVVVEGAYAGDAVTGAALLAPLRALAPAADTFAVVSPATIGVLHDEPAPAVLRRCEHLLVDELPAEAIDALLEAAGPAAGFPLDDVELRHLGGALCRRPIAAGALDALDAEVALTALAPPARELAIAELLDALAPWEAGHLHASFTARRVARRDVFTTDAVRRLLAVKALHDPDDVFAGPYSDPAGGRR